MCLETSFDGHSAAVVREWGGNMRQGSTVLMTTAAAARAWGGATPRCPWSPCEFLELPYFFHFDAQPEPPV